MASSLLNILRFLSFLFLLSLFKQMQFSTSLPPKCHSEERSALLQFKQSFVLDKTASQDPSAYPKVKSWNQRGETHDCCLWDGVECDKRTGRVIGLDLSSSYLYGSINSSSSLFQLVHLQRLSLADNHFNYSEIPVGFQYLSMLTHLNLSSSGFYGQIPLEISKLTKLTFLDLSEGGDFFRESRNLQLKSLGLKRLVENLTRIQILHLVNVDISSEIPNSITNLSSLRSLHLKNCGMFGLFPMEIFNLSNLQELSVPINANLTGYLPEFQQGSPIEILRLRETNFSGRLPTSIGNLHSLTWLQIAFCKFYGPLPSSLGNLTNLRTLNLMYNNFQGQIPSSLENLIELRILTLQSNCLTGRIPFWLGNLTQLTILGLADNELHDHIPNSIFKLVNLEDLSLGSNHLSGFLAHNNFSSLIEPNENATFPKLRDLDIRWCNLREFPKFLRYQDKLEFLLLDGNNIHGPIPNWLWNIGKETMWCLTLDFNSLTGFEKPLSVSSMSKLQVLHLQSNKLQGQIPIPPPSIIEYIISNNRLIGQIPSTLCSLSYLQSLDLSHNNLSGIIPQYFFNSENLLLALDLGYNALHGTIPETFKTGCKLQLIDLRHNELQGKIPLSLANQIALEILNLGHNKIVDKFPYWLGALPNLTILILQSNKLFGEIGKPTVVGFNFSMLRIIDLSYNGFTGVLPSKYFQNWNSMRSFDKNEFSYMVGEINLLHAHDNMTGYSYYYRLSMINKGMDMEYMKIPNILVAIDLSCNKFEGNIPESIVTLKKLQLLNLSNNHLSGHIPSQIESLTELEALDLSGNMLTGVIPQQLVQLTFLSFFNVSNNWLVGPIPHGKQFDTYENNSYMNNLGLCGKPLSNMCENAPLASIAEDDQGSYSSAYIEWKAIVIGYWSGLVVAVMITHGVWIIKAFRRRQVRRGSQKKWGGRF